MTNGQPHDELLEALDELLVVLRESSARNRVAIRQAEAIRKLVPTKASTVSIFSSTNRPDWVRKTSLAATGRKAGLPFWE